MTRSRDGLSLLALAVLLVAAVLLGDGQRHLLALVSQFAIALLACAAYQLLWHDGGMLSFGHAIHAGFGGYAAVHLMQALPGLAQAGSPVLATLAVALLPLAGGLAGLACAIGPGWLATRHGGTALAMVTLALAELMAAAALMLPAAFGGESGLGADRVPAPGGWTWGPDRAVHLLVVVWSLLGLLMLLAWRGTPAGRLLLAVREQPQRVAALGFDPAALRWRALWVAGLCSGIAGALMALLHERVTPQAFGLERSGQLVLAATVGGAGGLLGAVCAAWVSVLAFGPLAAWSRAWPALLGLGFIAVVRWAPGGLAGCLRGLPAGLHRIGRLPAAARGRALSALGLRGLGVALMLPGIVLLAELAYHRQLDAALGPWLVRGALRLDSGAAWSWLLLLALVVCGLLAWRRGGRGLAGLAQAGAVIAARAAADPAGGATGDGEVDQPAADHGGRAARGADASGRRDGPRREVAAVPPASVPGAAATEALVLDGVSLRIGRSRILDRVDLVLPAGECLALIGPNGAGKSSLLQLVSGGRAASAGTVRWAGRRLDGGGAVRAARRGVARSFQRSQLWPALSVRDHLRCALLRPCGVGAAMTRSLASHAVLEGQCAQWLQRLGLADDASTPVGQLGYARQRLVELALAVVGGQPLVLLDEPTAGMNVDEARRAVALIRELTAGRTVLLVEHDLGVVFDLADRVAVLDQGRLLCCDEPQRVRDDPVVQAVYPGLAGWAGAGADRGADDRLIIGRPADAAHSGARSPARSPATSGAPASPMPPMSPEPPTPATPPTSSIPPRWPAPPTPAASVPTPACRPPACGRPDRGDA